METMSGIRSQILGHLRSLGFVRSNGPGNIHDLNKNANHWATVKACIVAGLYPNIAHIDKKKATLTSFDVPKMGIHKSSILRNVTSEKKQDFKRIPTEWMVFEEKIRIFNHLLAHTNTVVTPFTIAMFTGPMAMSEENNLFQLRESDDSDSEVEEHDETQLTRMVIDDWIQFDCDTEAAYLIFHLRLKLMALLRRLLSNPKYFFSDDKKNYVIQVVNEVLMLEDQFSKLPQPGGVGKPPRSIQLAYTPMNNYSLPIQQPPVVMNQKHEKQPGAVKILKRQETDRQNPTLKPPVTHNLQKMAFSQQNNSHLGSKPVKQEGYIDLKGWIQENFGQLPPPNHQIQNANDQVSSFFNKAGLINQTHTKTTQKPSEILPEVQALFNSAAAHQKQQQLPHSSKNFYNQAYQFNQHALTQNQHVATKTWNGRSRKSKQELQITPAQPSIQREINMQQFFSHHPQPNSFKHYHSDVGHHVESFKRNFDNNHHNRKASHSVLANIHQPPLLPCKKFFIVRAASIEQISVTIKSGAWNFASSIRNQLLQLLRHHPQTKVTILFNISSDKMLGCFTLMLLGDSRSKIKFEMLVDIVLSYSVVRKLLDDSKLSFTKYVDEYFDGEEIPEDIASHLFTEFMTMKNRIN